MWLAEIPVADGGPSAPAWAFFTAITLGILGILGEQIRSKRIAIAARDEAKTAAESAEETKANTRNISNGFAGRMDRKLDGLQDTVNQIAQAQLKHAQWHLENDGRKDNG